MAMSSTEKIVRVSNRSDPHAVAAVIANAAYAGRLLLVRAIGAGAVNQAVKASAIAVSFAEERGYTLAFVPGFETVIMDDNAERSAITLQTILL